MSAHTLRLVALLLFTAAGRAAADGSIALIGGQLIDGTGADAINSSVVIIEDGLITDVARKGQTTIPPNALRIDTSGKSVLPGLIDTHVHFSLVGHGDYQRWYEMYPTRRTRKEVFPLSIEAELRAGVTSALDLGAEIESIFWLRDQIRQGKLQGPQIFIAGPMLCTPERAQTSSLSQSNWWIVEGAEDGRNKVRTLAERGVDTIKLWDDNFSDAEFRAMINEAHSHGLHVAAHLLTEEGMYRALRNGLSALDTIHHVGASAGDQYPDELVEMILEQRVYLVPTIIAFDGFRQFVEDPSMIDDPNWASTLGEELFEEVHRSFLKIDPIENSLYDYAVNLRRDRRSKLQQLYQAGATFMLGTDAGSRANPHHAAAWREMVLMVEEIGMQNVEVIQSATRIAAEVLGVNDSVGTIERGKVGDVIVIDGDPLTDMAAMQFVDHVIKGGQIIY